MIPISITMEFDSSTYVKWHQRLYLIMISGISIFDDILVQCLKLICIFTYTWSWKVLPLLSIRFQKLLEKFEASFPGRWIKLIFFNFWIIQRRKSIKEELWEDFVDKEIDKETSKIVLLHKTLTWSGLSHDANMTIWLEQS